MIKSEAVEYKEVATNKISFHSFCKKEEQWKI